MCKHKEFQGLIAIYVHQIVFKTEVAAVKSYLNDVKDYLLTKGILFFKFTLRRSRISLDIKTTILAVSKHSL